MLGLATHRAKAGMKRYRGHIRGCGVVNVGTTHGSSACVRLSTGTQGQV